MQTLDTTSAQTFCSKVYEIANSQAKKRTVTTTKTITAGDLIFAIKRLSTEPTKRDLSPLSTEINNILSMAAEPSSDTTKVLESIAKIFLKASEEKREKISTPRKNQKSATKPESKEKLVEKNISTQLYEFGKALKNITKIQRLDRPSQEAVRLASKRFRHEDRPIEGIRDTIEMIRLKFKEWGNELQKSWAGVPMEERRPYIDALTKAQAEINDTTKTPEEIKETLSTLLTEIDKKAIHTLIYSTILGPFYKRNASTPFETEILRHLHRNGFIDLKDLIKKTKDKSDKKDAALMAQIFKDLVSDKSFMNALTDKNAPFAMMIRTHTGISDLINQVNTGISDLINQVNKRKTPPQN